MKNTVRCCVSCILPCGALDVIRIVHTSGRVEEISGTIRASEVMKAHPKHVLKKPSSPGEAGDTAPKIVIVAPDAELQRGKIYFLMPVPSTSDTKSTTRSSRGSGARRKRRESGNTISITNDGSNNLSSNINNSISITTNLLISDQYLSEILSERISTQRDRRRGRVGVWRPHLESISESQNDA